MLITVSTAAVLHSQQKTPAVLANIQDVEAGESLDITMSRCTVALKEVVLQQSEFRCIHCITIAEQRLVFHSIRLQRAKQIRINAVVQTVVVATNAHTMRQWLLRHVARPRQDASHVMWLNSTAMEF
jgi:hypothetical protein